MREEERKKCEQRKEAVNLQKGRRGRATGVSTAKCFCFNIQEGPRTLDMSWTTGEDHRFPVQ